MASVNRNVERIIAGLDGVHLAVMAEAEKVAVTARALLAEHRDTGEAQIEVHKAGRKDAVVELVDPAALSIEYGHFAGKRGVKERTFVEGLHILGRAADL